MERRIELLERRVRWLQAMAGLAIVGTMVLGALLWRQSPSQQVVRARVFAVVDGNGRTVASLGNESSGPLLRMHSIAADVDLVAGAFGPNVGLFILADKERVRAMLAAGRLGKDPALTLSDSAGKSRFVIGTESDEEGGGPLLVMYDKQGRARLYSRVRDEPIFVIRSEAGKSEWGFRQPDLP